jgi:hypothetical protein
LALEIRCALVYQLAPPGKRCSAGNSLLFCPPSNNRYETCLLTNFDYAWLACLLPILTACVNTSGTGFSYNEVAIVNQTRSPIHEVTAAASGSGRMFSCANVAPQGICSNRFPPRPYSGEAIEVAWTVAGRRRSETIEVKVPPGFVRNIPMRGILVIDARGQATVYLQQAAPGPHL